MSKKYFYSHIVATEDISLAIADMDMPQEERVKLIALAHENLHHAILDTILDELPEKEKKDFLLHLHQDEHDKAWIILKEKVDDAEVKILKVAKKMKDELHKDIKEASK